MSHARKPLVTVITVVRNAVTTIGLTLDSVRAQRQVDVEHVVVDGASSDGTLDVIKARQSDNLRWISESDKGIYDAMNKGISLAQGEWLLFLGADDVLADPMVLADIFQQRDVVEYDLVCGRSAYTDGRVCVPRLDWHTLIFNTMHHQAVFYRRHLFDGFRYRLDIPVLADYEMNFLIYQQRRPVLFLERPVAVSGVHGISHTSSQFFGQIDAYKIRSRYLNVMLNSVLLAAGMINLLIVRLMARSPQSER